MTMSRFHSQTRPRTTRIFILATICAVSGLAGCQKVLFPHDEPRTQYETYDQMRQKFQPLEVTDVFGTPQPALRARLSPNTDS